ncbi:MAG: hypothetical protein ACR2P4_06455 [Gammaproteobacteria bacterium]
MISLVSPLRAYFIPRQPDKRASRVRDGSSIAQDSPESPENTASAAFFAAAAGF